MTCDVSNITCCNTIKIYPKKTNNDIVAEKIRREIVSADIDFLKWPTEP